MEIFLFSKVENGSKNIEIMGKTFVYNSGSYKEEDQGVLSMEFGLFFDGTANNLYNTDARKYMTYKKIEKGKLSKRAKEELDRIKGEYAEGGIASAKHTLGELEEGYKKYGKENVNYGNDHTNVARMYLNADRLDYAIYIEGVGTKDLKGDYSLRGISYADGVTGLLAKVKKGSEELVQRIKMLYDRKKRNSEIKIRKIVLTLDVFGFSRGAAAARHFLFQVSHNKHLEKKTQATSTDSLDNMVEVPESEMIIAMKKEKMLASFAKNITINIRFAGLYDTVASFNPYSWSFATNRIMVDTLSTKYEKYIHLLRLNDIGKPRLVVHFTALDDIRRYFSLTRLAPFLGIEKNLPGAHSDVGGSYECDVKAIEEVLLKKDFEYEKINDLKKELIKAAWYMSDDFIVELKSYVGKAVRGKYWLWGKRKINGEYSYLPLQWMLKYASFQIKEGQLKIERMNGLYKIDSGTILCEVQKHLDSTTFKELANMTYGIKGYGELNRFIARDRIVQKDWTFESGIAQELLKKLRYGYLHQSAHYEGAVEPHAPNDDRKRREFPG